MDLTEKKSSHNEVLTLIKEKFSGRYDKRVLPDKTCFINEHGVLFDAFSFPEWDAFGVEYANTEEEAQKWQFEDGDLFYLADYDTVDDMVEAMCKEIDNT